MQRDRNAPRVFIRPRALYSIAQLAQFAGLTRFVLRRLLDSHGVQFVRSGRTVLVPLTEVEDKIPLLWKNLWRLESARLTEPEAMPAEEMGARRVSSAPPTGFLSAGRRSRRVQQRSE
jgi:excisionase family DNA binding protein